MNEEYINQDSLLSKDQEIGKYEAILYKAGSSEANYINVNLSLTRIQFTVDNEQVSISISDAKLTPVLGEIPREVKLAGGYTLVFQPDVPIENFFNAPHYKWLTSVEKHKRYFLSALVLVPIFFVFIIKFVIPAAARNIAPHMPQSVNQRIDKQTLFTFDKVMLNKSELTPEVKSTITKNWSAMINKINTTDLPIGDHYTLLFRSSKLLGANAFALPGGTVVITDGLVTLLKDNPEAIQAILLHEIGHVYYHHGMQMMAESLGITLLMTYVLGDLDGVAEMFNGISATLIQNKFSQALEAQADDFSLVQLSTLGISATALADAFIALSQDIGSEELFLEEYYSAHPSIKSRITKAQQH